MLTAVAIVAIVGGHLGRTATASTESSATGAQSRVVIDRSLPQINGSHLKVFVVEVSYPPGGFSHEHSHPCPVLGYVLEGALRTHVERRARGRLLHRRPEFLRSAQRYPSSVG